MQVKERKKIRSKMTQPSSQSFCKEQIAETLIKEKFIRIKLHCYLMDRCNSIYTGYKEALDKHVGERQACFSFFCLSRVCAHSNI